MPTLALVNFNIVCASLGGFITLFGLVSYLLKEKFYFGEALISTIAGIAFSPHGTNWIRPLEYAQGNEENLDFITFYFTRLVLGVQLVLAGVQLPSKYLKTERKSLALLLGPGMTVMWISTSLLVWAMVPNIPFLWALAVGACVTPTDPVLSNSIVKGKFADKHIPRELQKIIIAESGANDGLGYPFLFLPLYIIKYVERHGAGNVDAGPGTAMKYWFAETWLYVIVLSVVYGAVVGWVAKELLHWAEDRKYVDRESFLVFAITLALFIVGTVGMIGSDDVLACFIAGNTFTWDDWFRQETLDDSLQPTIDMLLNVSVFMWFGAVCPWYSFAHNNVIPIYRLIFLGILVLLFRRLPIVYAMHKHIHQIEQKRQALFVGFFGPIGVSAIFYLYISRDFFRQIIENGHEREDAERLSEIFTVVIWFLVMCSIIVHGLSIPLGKFGFHFPRIISQAISADRSDSRGNGSTLPFQIARPQSIPTTNGNAVDSDEPRLPHFHIPHGHRPIFRIGGRVITKQTSKSRSRNQSRNRSESPNPAGTRTRGRDENSRSRSRPASPNRESGTATPLERTVQGTGAPASAGHNTPLASPFAKDPKRTIRFPDDEEMTVGSQLAKKLESEHRDPEVGEVGGRGNEGRET